MFVVYDRELHDKILVDIIRETSPDKERKLRRFYHHMYDRYCRDGCVNKWFYAFSLDDLESEYTDAFKYRWLLQLVNGDPKRPAKFKNIPQTSTEDTKKNLSDAIDDFKLKFENKLVNSIQVS